MGLRFGLDIGIASVGWAVVSDTYEVLESGANIFPAADANMNAERRSFRQMKRLHRRRAVRVKDFEKLWREKNGAVPTQTCSNPLELRVQGLSEQLAKEQIYFVLKNMLLHRGIAYLEDAMDDSTAGSDYKKGLQMNQKELGLHKYPCEIQLERLQAYGRYRGEVTITEDGDNVTLSNVFTVGAYKRELTKFLETQKVFHEFLDETFIAAYMSIFSRKREYYVGPGNERSRTDYGRYTTQINPETGEYITEENIF